ncbi:hypothetical protein DPMN_102822 [Dreissena polymorpha]|uniref:Uncharacterized protein n=1 Tax=Dreissena polymorpha TaxID=45954 RepID=A0A9D4JZI8_DREPO|nr:hypothetical protein DPMN_102822 [Dreissena polymorpha]
MLARSDYNWIKCNLAQRDVKNVLAEFVEEDIKDLQQHLLHNVQTSKGLPSNTICNRCRIQNLLKCPTGKMCKFKNKACSFHKDASLKPRQCPTNGLCGDIRIGIIDHHRYGGPSWKNTDASKWCTDSWTIAKCYMPPDGYLNVKSADNTDFNGVLSVIINCIYCQRRFSKDLNKLINVCTKARDKSRDVRHSPNLKLSDDERDSIIDTLVDLLNDSMFIRNNQRSVECREKLTKLKSNALSISTTDKTHASEDSVQTINQAFDL